MPRHVEIVDALPVNATGKVLKHELRARWLGTRPHDSNERTDVDGHADAHPQDAS